MSFARALSIGPVPVQGLAAALAFLFAGAGPAPQAADEPTGSQAEARKVIQEAIERAAANGSPEAQAGKPSPAAPAAEEPEGLLLARVSAEVAARQLEAKRLAQKSPGDALEMLDGVAESLADQAIPADARNRLLRRIERTRLDIEAATGKRRAELALERRNEKIEAEIDGQRARSVEVDQRIALLVDEYNSLIDERRYPEAEAVAKKAGQLAPDNPVVRQLLAQSRTIRRLDTQRSIDGNNQEGLLDVFEDVARSARPMAGSIEFPNTRE
jgi:general secretion pathway protein D